MTELKEETKETEFTEKEKNESIKQMIKVIADLCIRINLETEHTCFFRVSGHVGGVEVHIHKTKDCTSETLYDSDMIYYKRDWMKFDNSYKNLSYLAGAMEMFL